MAGKSEDTEAPIHGGLYEPRAVEVPPAQQDEARQFKELGELKDGGEGWLVDEHDQLWKARDVEPVSGWDPARHAFRRVDPEGEVLHWFQRPSPGMPQTSAEREAARPEVVAAARRANPPTRAITYADLHPGLGPGPLTLRSLAERIEGEGGVLVVKAGRLFITGVPGHWVSALVTAAHVAEEAILEAVGGKDGAIDPAALPWIEFSPSGALLGPGLRGRA